jgi:hypothetical protein
MLPFNIVAGVVSSILSMVLGFIWYGPMLFADAWMKESKLTAKEIGNGPGMGYLLTMVAAFIMALTTSALVHMLNIRDVANGIGFGLMVGLGYVATTLATNYIFGLRSMKLYLIDAGYQVINIVIAAVVAVLIF